MNQGCWAQGRVLLSLGAPSQRWRSKKQWLEAMVSSEMQGGPRAREPRGEGALGEGRSHTGLTRLPLSFLYSPQPKAREGRRELGLTKNNNEITITKANPGARALAAPEPTVNKQSANCLPDKLVPKSSVTGKERRHRRR